jgi:uncharacterized protein YjeT (DUF2065 family)
MRSTSSLALALLLVLASPAAAQAPAAVVEAIRACESSPGAPVRIAGTSLCFSGDIDRSSTDRAIALFGERSLVAMVITSDGGEVTAAIRLARALRARGVLLVVQRRCISSCANFLFPAARTKAVAPRSLVVFHGGIAPAAFGGLFGGGEERDLLALTRSFFREIGVDGSFTYDPPYRPGSRELAEAWTASPAALRRHGVTGIVSMWWPSSAAVVAEGAAQRLPLGVVE